MFLPPRIGMLRNLILLMVLTALHAGQSLEREISLPESFDEDGPLDNYHYHYNYSRWGEYSVEAVVSYADFKVRKPRDSWKTLLRYWPAFWDISLYIDFENPVHFVRCLNRSFFPVRVYYEQEGDFNRNKRGDFLKNHWKFYLDRYTSSDVLAIIDDDACLLHPITYNHVFDEKGRIITRAIRFIEKSHYAYSTDVFPDWAGVGDFMTDFPVYVWREMITDLRQDLTNRFTPNGTFADTFQQLMDFSLNKTVAFHMSEYNLLLHYAFNSPKWKDRYQWQVFHARGRFNDNDTFIIAGSTHQHGTGVCPGLQVTPPDSVLLYPRNIFHPWDDDAKNFEKERKSNSKNLAITAGDWLEEQAETTAFSDYLAQRREIWRRDMAHDFSRIDADPRIYKQWAKCYRNVH